MILDKKLMFFDGADITGASAEVDLGITDYPKGEPLKFFANVANAAGTGISLALHTATASGGSFSAVVTWAPTAAQLQAGFNAFINPDNMNRYMKVVISGTGLSGTGSMGLAHSVQSNV